MAKLTGSRSPAVAMAARRRLTFGSAAPPSRSRFLALSGF